MRSSRRVFCLLAAGLVAPACLAPTLPLPPPSRPDVEGPDARGRVTLSGTVVPGGEVLALNRRTDLVFGQLTGPSGNYRFEIEAEVGDRIELWYVDGQRVSPSIEFVIPAP